MEACSPLNCHTRGNDQCIIVSSQLCRIVVLVRIDHMSENSNKSMGEAEIGYGEDINLGCPQVYCIDVSTANRQLTMECRDVET